jgi:hypothetical protein
VFLVKKQLAQNMKIENISRSGQTRIILSLAPGSLLRFQKASLKRWVSVIWTFSGALARFEGAFALGHG